MQDWMSKMSHDFNVAFIQDNRWKYLVKGIQNTLILTSFLHF